MGRRNWQDGVEIVLEDLNAVSKAIERNLFDRVLYEIIHRQEDAFFDDSFLVSFTGPTSVLVKNGSGFQTDSSQTSPEPDKRLLFRSADVPKTISTPDGSQDRIDIVVCKNALVDELSDTRKYKAPVTGVITDETVVLQKDWEAEIDIVAGTPAGSPVAPATPAGYIKIAELEVTAVTGMSGAGAVTDTRTTVPIGAGTFINTVGYLRLTAGATTPLSTLFADIDALLKNGLYEYCDMEEMDAAPGSPAADYRRIYYLEDGVLYEKNSSGDVRQIHAGLQLNQSILNNQGATNITGFVFDKASVKSVVAEFSIDRSTDSSNVQEVGKIYLVNDAKDDVWRVTIASNFDDAGVTFSVDTSTGQVKYASDDLAGASYTGAIVISNIVRLYQS